MVRENLFGRTELFERRVRDLKQDATIDELAKLLGLLGAVEDDVDVDVGCGRKVGGVGELGDGAGEEDALESGQLAPFLHHPLARALFSIADDHGLSASIAVHLSP